MVVNSDGSYDGIEYHYFKAMSLLLNFSFEFIDYTSFGRQQPNGEWDGVIGDLVIKVNLIRFIIFKYLQTYINLGTGRCLIRSECR